MKQYAVAAAILAATQSSAFAVTVTAVDCYAASASEESQIKVTFDEDPASTSTINLSLKSNASDGNPVTIDGSSAYDNDTNVFTVTINEVTIAALVNRNFTNEPFLEVLADSNVSLSSCG